MEEKTKCYRVTVKAEGNEPETYCVNAPREGLAKTNAMALYRQTLAGRGVTYEIAEVSDTASLKAAADVDAHFAAKAAAYKKQMGL